jgi:alcohol dehydrogenase
MRRFVQTGYGDISANVAMIEESVPVPSSGEVLIEVFAASLNPIDYKIVQGALKMVQKLSFPSPMGFDGSGIVAAVGSQVSGLAIGDPVYFRAPRERRGSFAEQILIDQAFVTAKPERLSHQEAASLPLVALTVVQGLKDRAKAKAGQSILIHAGSGGVGSFAIQYAKALGLSVTTTTSSRNVEMVRALGADHVIAYDQQDYRDLPGRYDIVFDTLGKEATIDAFSVAKRGGAVVSISGPPTAEMAAQLGAGFLMRNIMALLRRKVMAASRRTGVAYYGFFTESNGSQLAEVASLVDAGSIKAIIDRCFPFDELVAALDLLMSGRTRGKIVLNVREAVA